MVAAPRDSGRVASNARGDEQDPLSALSLAPPSCSSAGRFQSTQRADNTGAGQQFEEPVGE